jgi:hypothetical protein
MPQPQNTNKNMPRALILLALTLVALSPSWPLANVNGHTSETSSHHSIHTDEDTLLAAELLLTKKRTKRENEEAEAEEEKGRCVMYEACSPNPTKPGQPVHMNHVRSDDPFQYKWTNCRVDHAPVPLRDSRALDDFRRMCSPLYSQLLNARRRTKNKSTSGTKRSENDDDNFDLNEMGVCCSANQIEILKRDLATAEAIVGSCPACFANFRAMWCHMTCVIKIFFFCKFYSLFSFIIIL